MKKILTLCAGLLLVFGLSACDETGSLPHPGEEEPDPEVTEPEPETGDDGGGTGDGGETQYVELTLGKYEYELEVSSEEELVVTTNTPASITFSSTDDSIAYATENDGSYYIYSGAVTGEAIITVTATADGWEEDSKDVKVTVTETPDTDPVVTGISFDSESYEIQVGGEPIDFASHITVAGTNNPTQEFTLTSDDTTGEYITISDNVVTAVSETIEDTPITLTATREDHGNTHTATAELTVLTAEEVTPEVTNIYFVGSPYQVTFKIGQANTLDLSNAVTVEGNEALSDKTFTITCENGESENDNISISNNIVTIKNPSSASISIKAYANADTSKTATGVINVSDGTTYVTDIAFEGITGNEITLYTGNTDEDHPGSASVTATVSPEGVYESGYDITVEDTSVAKWENNTLTAVGEGTTKITATSKGLTSYNGQPKTCEATVKVEYLKTPVSSITLSSSTQDVYSQGSFTIGPSDSGADITVTVGPEGADEQGWEAKASDDGKLTVSGPDTYGVYTVVAETLADGSAVDTSSIVISPTGYANANVSATLSVRILPNDYGVTHVTAITLSTYAMSAKEGDIITIGAADKSPDVSVSVEPTNADNQAYSVTCDATDKISVSAPDETTGLVTVTVNEGAGGTDAEGQTYNIVVTADDTMCSEPATLVLTVARPDSVATSWEVSGGDNLSLEVPAVNAPATESLDLDQHLTITIYDQYGETMSGEGITGGYTITDYDENVVSVSEHTISAVAGTVTNQSTTITISSTDISATATLTITLTAVKYDATAVTFNGSESVTETVEWGGTLTGTVEVTPSYVTETGYTVTCTSGVNNFTNTIEGDTLTFTHDSATAGTSVYTITSTDGKASCTVTLTVEPQVISIASAKFAESVATTAYKGGTLALSKEMVEVTYEETSLSSPNYTEEEYDVSFEAGSNVTIDGDTATFTAAGTGVINATVTGQTSAKVVYAVLSVTVSAYVESISLSASTTEIEGGTGNVTITATLNSDATNTALTWSSSNSEVIDTSSVGNGTYITVTPAVITSDTEVTITATAQDGSNASNSITIKVTAPAPTSIESYTLSFTFSNSPSVSGLEKIYIVGSWMESQEAGAWDLTNLTTELSVSDNVYSTTLTNVEIGAELKYAIVVGLNSNFSYTDYNATDSPTTTVGDYPWYANTIVYEGSATPAPDGNNYSNVTKSVATGVSIDIFTTNPGWSDAMNMTYTIALQDTGEIGTSWTGGEGKNGSFYFDLQGNYYKGADGDKAQRTLTADTENDYSYDFYYDYGSVYGASNDLGFAVAPDEYETDLYNDGLIPTEDLSTAISGYSHDSDGEPFASYVGYNINSDSCWDVMFWNMYGAGNNPFPFVNSMAMVLDVDFSSTKYENWSAQKVVYGFHFVINGNIVNGISVPFPSTSGN